MILLLQNYLLAAQNIVKYFKHKMCTQKLLFWDFPGGPVDGNPPHNAGDAVLIPGWGTKIPNATGQLTL